jgi:hypothetical protein
MNILVDQVLGLGYRRQAREVDATVVEHGRGLIVGHGHG